MLSKLSIQHYAIIDSLEISFSERLNIITGETGAGKSILIGALNLVLGERADTSILQPGKKCVVEGVFQVENQLVEDFLRSNDLDVLGELVLRREISVGGKSRNFINDTPVSLAQVKELSTLLVDLHQQFDTLELSSENFQRMVLDALADNRDELVKLGSEYVQFTAVKKELDLLVQKQDDANKEQDYLKFLYDELESLDPKPNEFEELDAELALLSNAENIRQGLTSVIQLLKEGEEPVVRQLKAAMQKLDALSGFHTDIAIQNERVKSALIEVQDIADEIIHIDGSIGVDAERIHFINERISAGYRLFKKHNVKTTQELIQVRDDLSGKLDSIMDISNSIEKLNARSAELHNRLLVTVGKISQKRGKAVKPFVEKVNELLKQVGMPNAKLKVEIGPGTLSATGSDQIDFLFDANKSGRFEPLKKVASGGELSRLMLVIKSLVASKLELPTLIFDEIDSGISGEAARQVGKIMAELSSKHQVMAITHQPQIAAKADAHYFVYKSISNDRIVTSIRLLNEDERITAIAQMLGGEKPTAAAMENAREMVRN